jgi:hypothetical protein
LLQNETLHALQSTEIFKNVPFFIIVIYENGVFNGFIIMLDYPGFVLVMNQPPVVKTGTLLDDCTNRPGEIAVNIRLRQDILRIFWERPGEDRSITIEWLYQAGVWLARVLNEALWPE